VTTDGGTAADYVVHAYGAVQFVDSPERLVQTCKKMVKKSKELLTTFNASHVDRGLFKEMLCLPLSNLLLIPYKIALLLS